MATSHQCAAIPNFLVQEWHALEEREVWDSYVRAPDGSGSIVKDGYITLPDTPGIGVELDMDGVGRARRARIRHFRVARRTAGRQASSRGVNVALPSASRGTESPDATHSDGELALAAAVTLAACGGSSGSASTDSLTAWDWSPAPDVWGEGQQTTFYSKTFPKRYPKLHFSYTIYGYTDVVPKLTVAWRGGSTPDVARVVNASCPQFVNEGLTAEITEADLGIPFSHFWPQALQSVRKGGASSGPLYGIPTNNEAMMVIYNKDLFKQAGLDPSHGPATWTDLVRYANTVKQKTGKYGYGLVGVQNNGNTPYRFCPMMWAHGGSIFDELSPNPTWKKVGINSAGHRRCPGAVPADVQRRWQRAAVGLVGPRVGRRHALHQGRGRDDDRPPGRRARRCCKRSRTSTWVPT